MRLSGHLVFLVCSVGLIACGGHAKVTVKAGTPTASAPPPPPPPPVVVTPPPPVEPPPPVTTPHPAHTPADDKILRIGANGKADASFGEEATAKAPNRVALLSYDKAGGLLVFGQEAHGGDSVVTVSRLTPDGKPDIAFGGGKAVTLGTGGVTTARSAYVDPLGRILFLTTTKNAAGATSAMVHRFVATGLDTSFNKTGSAPVAADSDSDWSGVSYDPGSARIVLVGYRKLGKDKEKHGVFITKYRADGSFDSTFYAAASDNLEPIRLMIDDVSRIYVVANRVDKVGDAIGPDSVTPDRVTAVVAYRFGPNGAADAGFGSNGILEITQQGKTMGALDAFISPGGPGPWHPTQLVVGGWLSESKDGSHMQPIVTRFNDKGSLDSSFASGGRAELTDAASTHGGRIRRVARDGTGRVIAVGGYRSGETESAKSTATTFVARLSNGGEMDGTYGSGGGGYFGTDSFVPEIDPQGRVLLRSP